MFLFYSLAMFYVIALAGAHKKVISQLREQLAMVCLLILKKRVYLTVVCAWRLFWLKSTITVSFGSLGGSWQTLPDPEDAPGPEKLQLRIQAAQQQQEPPEPLLPHQLRQKLPRGDAPGTLTTKLLHTSVKKRLRITGKKNPDPTLKWARKLWIGKLFMCVNTNMYVPPQTCNADISVSWVLRVILFTIRILLNSVRTNIF